MKVVVYYRTRPDDPAGSDLSLSAQKAFVGGWLELKTSHVVAEYTEEEGGGADRPALAGAIAECNRLGATLLIAGTDPIGGGERFEPRIASVPVHVPPPPVSTSKPTIIPSADDAPAVCSLQFLPQADSHLVSIYLCNPGPAVLRDVTVTSQGRLDDTPNRDPILTTISTKKAAIIEPKTCHFVEAYDRVWDGDFTTAYEIKFINSDGIRQSASASIPKGGPTRKWLQLKLTDEQSSCI